MTASVVEQAERKGRRMADFLGVWAVMLTLLLVLTVGQTGRDFLAGFQSGLCATALLYLTPFLRWFRPNNAVARLLDDEGTREHRRTAAGAGLAASTIAAIVMLVVTGRTTAVSAPDTARIIMTAGVAAALLCFSVLERRARQ